VWRCLRDLTFSHFGTIPACDGLTDRQTHRQTDGRTDTRRQHIGYRASIASRDKNFTTLVSVVLEI